jgi:hypothetical protein
MIDNIKENPLTAFLLAFTLVLALGGIVVVIVHPETMTYPQLLDRLQEFAIALGIVGVGKGIASAGNAHLAARKLDSLEADPTDSRALHGPPTEATTITGTGRGPR